jgi:hypothetical protein
VYCAAFNIVRSEAVTIVFIVEPITDAVVAICPTIAPAEIAPKVLGLLSDREALVHVDLGRSVHVEVAKCNLAHPLRKRIANQPAAPAPVAAPPGVSTLSVEGEVPVRRGSAEDGVDELALPVPQAVAAAVAADVLSVMQDWVEALPVAVRPFGVVRRLGVTRRWREVKVSVLPPGGLTCTA